MGTPSPPAISLMLGKTDVRQKVFLRLMQQVEVLRVENNAGRVAVVKADLLADREPHGWRSLKRCSLPVSVRGRLVDELDLARVLEGRERGLDVVLQGLGHGRVAGVAGLEHAQRP